jgi:hypothetical protein
MKRAPVCLALIVALPWVLLVVGAAIVWQVAR